ncbi:MAG: hypothetical protein AAFO83_04285 [Cyanobacteria bacterium J06607_13]
MLQLIRLISLLHVFTDRLAENHLLSAKVNPIQLKDSVKLRVDFITP